MPPDHGGHGGGIDGPTFRGTIDHAANGFDLTRVLRDLDHGTVSTTADGRTLREWSIFAAGGATPALMIAIGIGLHNLA